MIIYFININIEYKSRLEYYNNKCIKIKIKSNKIVKQYYHIQNTY